MTDKSFIGDALYPIYSDMVIKDKLLTVNSNNTVQPVALMRLGVFVPKPTKSQGENNIIDASELFSQLEIARAEGYDHINISGPRLDVNSYECYDDIAYFQVMQCYGNLPAYILRALTLHSRPSTHIVEYFKHS